MFDMAKLKLPCYGGSNIRFQDNNATLLGPNSVYIARENMAIQISNESADKLLIFLLERYKRIHDKPM